MSVVDQFKGLPMNALIGGPLKAAVEANMLLARSTADFINDVGFVPTKDENGNMVPGAPRMSDFSFERPGKDPDGNPTIEVVKIKVPMLAIVPVPNLQVNNVDIVFDMEVKSSTTDTSKTSASASLEASVSGGWGPVSASVKISGSVSTAKENTRSTDTSAKYHVEVNARNFGIPEGLARVLDMMHQAAQPRQVEAYKPNAKGELDRDEKGNPTGQPKLVDAEGTPRETE